MLSLLSSTVFVKYENYKFSHLSSLHFLTPFVIKNKKKKLLIGLYIYIILKHPSRKLANMVLLKNFNKKVGSFDATRSCRSDSVVFRV